MNTLITGKPDPNTLRELSLGIRDALMIGDATQVSVSEVSVSEDQLNRTMALSIINRMASRGDFGNSLTRYKTAEHILEQALQAQIALNYLQVGDGFFSLKDIAETSWAKRLGIVNKPGGHPQSILTLTAGNTIRSLLANGSLIRIGHRYKLGDLRSVLAKF